MIERTVSLAEACPGEVLSLPLGEAADAPTALLSLRTGGSMEFRHSAQNPRRADFFRGRGIDPARVLAVELIHSRLVLFPSDPSELVGAQADGIIVEPGPWVPTVTVADCVPIWVRHSKSGAFGVLHSGWQGTGILESAVRGLSERYDARPSEVDVILGPSIGPCCYTVPEARARRFREEFGEGAAYVLEGAWRLDLGAANLALARRLGLRSVTRVVACTSCETRLGSYRREGAREYTRMVAAAAYPYPNQGAA